MAPSGQRHLLPRESLSAQYTCTVPTNPSFRNRRPHLIVRGLRGCRLRDGQASSNFVPSGGGGGGRGDATKLMTKPPPVRFDHDFFRCSISSASRAFSSCQRRICTPYEGGYAHHMKKVCTPYEEGVNDRLLRKCARHMRTSMPGIRVVTRTVCQV